jgi:hypothetical protein
MHVSGGDWHCHSSTFGLGWFVKRMKSQEGGIWRSCHFPAIPREGPGPTPSSWLCSPMQYPNGCLTFANVHGGPTLQRPHPRTCISSQQTTDGGDARRLDSATHRLFCGDVFMFCQEIPCKRTCLTRLNEKEGGWIFDTMLCELMIFIAARALRQLSSLSIASLHFGPKRLMAQIVRLLSNAQTPKIVNNQPLPTAFMIGAATMAPTQEKMFLTKLLTATPFDDCLGMNSVSIVVAMAKISIDPIP